MDIAAHLLWVGATVTVLHRRKPLARGTVISTLVLAVIPDVLQFLPVLWWVAFSDGTWPALVAHAGAAPSDRAVIPPTLMWVSHHLHCITHSAVIAGLVTAVGLALNRRFWIPLIGWWSHILIDVFTHSADFYAVPVLYPLSNWGFDGVAWNERWFMVLNYVALSATWIWIFRTAKHRRAQ
jgi:hypothetical protein